MVPDDTSPRAGSARAATRQPRALRHAGPLHLRLANSLRERIAGGEWDPEDRLPTEGALAAEYQVSRATVRGALRLLESQGLTRTRHGLGTFVTPYAPGIRVGLQELRSMTETIAAQGYRPGMEYHEAVIRPPTAQEAARLGLDRDPPGEVLATRRAVLADDRVVAFSYDAVPAALLPTGFRPQRLRGSLFAALEETLGVSPTAAVAELHAVSDPGIGWGERPAPPLYLLLDQVHHLPDHTAVLYARTYFIEGRFTFSILRTR